MDINPQLMPFDKMMELQTIALSAKSDTLDIFVLGDAQLTTFVHNGWMRPLDDLWSRYKEEYKLGDFADAAVRPLYSGRSYLCRAERYDRDVIVLSKRLA